MKRILFLFTLTLPILSFTQSHLKKVQELPVITGVYAEGIKKDWLVTSVETPSMIFKSEDNNNIILSNGIISRTIRLSPNATSISFKNLGNQDELLRAVSPEALVEINNFQIKVGGLGGQANLAFLYEDWIDELKASPMAFTFKDFSIGKPKARLEWNQIRPASNTVWPPKGVHLQMNYRMNDIPVQDLIKLSANSSTGRELLLEDFYTSLDKELNIHISNSHPRSSFNNEGKAGEIYTPKNTAVYAEYDLPENVGLIETIIEPGTDESSSWGAGIALIFKNQVIKFNLRTGTEEGANTSPFKFVVYDGEKENVRAGSKLDVSFDKTWKLRIRLEGNKANCEAAPLGEKWRLIEQIDVKGSENPIAVRVGKLGRKADGIDHQTQGKIIRLSIKSLKAYSKIKDEKIAETKEQLDLLKNIVVSVNYEMYDGVPVLSKWVEVQNNSSKNIKVNNIISEVLRLADFQPKGGYSGHYELRKKPNVYIETDYAFSNSDGEIASSHSVHWKTDQDYITQISWNQDILNRVEVYPKYGYHSSIKPQDKLESIRAFIVPLDSREEERRSLHIRKMKRIVAPWITENPMVFHLTGSNPEEVRNGVLQCNDVGYNMINFSFGSKLSMENIRPENIRKFRKYELLADSLNIKLGGYSLFSSRWISEEDDVINPETGKRGGFARFGGAPCAGSEWGINYYSNLRIFLKETGFKTLTQDGPYPGDICASTTHPGHHNLDDSQYKQWKITTDFYKWCKSEGIYLRLPDHYFLTGGNQTGVGYRENNWSLPRREQLIHTRQNIFDGTWEKTPGMSWSFIPLQQYHGGGAAATIEPLHEHLEHYEMMLVSNLGMGLQSVLRGKRIYDTEETKEMVKRVVAWYKKHQKILDSDIIHLKRADGRDLDYMMHVNPQLNEKGFLMVFNPTDQIIRKTISIPLYYTGLTKKASISEQNAKKKKYKLNRDYSIEIMVEVPPNWYNWFVIE